MFCSRISRVLGRSVDAALAVFPTGVGNSPCYRLSAQLIEAITLVISPLIALPGMTAA
jgi:superfamily II DNA helicase RecQ